MKYAAVMSKGLSDIDRVYGRLNQYATVSEKLKYCASLIHRTENFVARNNETLNEQVRKRSNDIIEAAKREIYRLSGQVADGKRTDN